MESGTVVAAGDGRDLELAWATDTGTVRARNEDRCAVLTTATASVLVLADGMGGHPGGDDAADAAVGAVRTALEAGVNSGDLGFDGEWMRLAVAEASSAVGKLEASERGRPGTTLDIVVVTREALLVAHVGDARVYRVAGGRVACLTGDHSWVGDEIRAGRLEAAAARGNSRRNIITRAITGDEVSPDLLLEAALASREGVVLCSDGVWEPIPDAELSRLWSAGTDLEEMVRGTCAAAMEAGSRDNVTVVAARRL